MFCFALVVFTLFSVFPRQVFVCGHIPLTPTMCGQTPKPPWFFFLLLSPSVSRVKPLFPLLKHVRAASFDCDSVKPTQRSFDGEGSFLVCLNTKLGLEGRLKLRRLGRDGHSALGERRDRGYGSQFIYVSTDREIRVH